MGILRTRHVWRRPAPTKARPLVAHKGHMDRLSPEQEANVRRALMVLRFRMGSLRAVSEAFGLNEKTAERVCRGRRHITAGWAVRIATELGVPVDDVLTGAFVVSGVCPMCGRS